MSDSKVVLASKRINEPLLMLELYYVFGEAFKGLHIGNSSVIIYGEFNSKDMVIVEHIYTAHEPDTDMRVVLKEQLKLVNSINDMKALLNSWINVGVI